MKILLDENLPHALRAKLPGHDVFTVSYLGWSGTKNGALLRLAANASFDAMLTMDSGVPYQQNIKAMSISVIVLSAASNDIDDLLPLVPATLKRLDNLAPSSVTHVP